MAINIIFGALTCLQKCFKNTRKSRILLKHIMLEISNLKKCGKDMFREFRKPESWCLLFAKFDLLIWELWSFETLGLRNYKTSKLWHFVIFNFEKLKLWNFATLKLQNFETLKLWNSGPSELWNLETWKLSNIETLNWVIN